LFFASSRHPEQWTGNSDVLIPRGSLGKLLKLEMIASAWR
jgi:hypothetical protein